MRNPTMKNETANVGRGHVPAVREAADGTKDKLVRSR